MTPGLELIQDDFSAKMEKMLSRGNNMKAAAARIYPVYQALQTKRFMTMNASEGKQWDSLNSKYKARKLVEYGGGKKRDGSNWKSFPGSGTKMMIATGTLAGAVIGPGSPFSGNDRHRAMFTSSSMVIEVEQSGTDGYGRPFDYASFADSKRHVMEFSHASVEKMKSALVEYLFKG